ncbi:MAG: integration host factor subunit beta [Tannerella sp.]|jgi:DNA-binding protein HU-beta|nr:integration host factor subunit beta [Tannerella sp.]
MTKAELISSISKSTGIEKATVTAVVASYFDAVKLSLVEGENVYLRSFGSFIIKTRAAKKARNISKNTTITIPEHTIPAFKPSKVFVSAVSNANGKKAKNKKKK